MALGYGCVCMTKTILFLEGHLVHMIYTNNYVLLLHTGKLKRDNPSYLFENSGGIGLFGREPRESLLDS